MADQTDDTQWGQSLGGDVSNIWNQINKVPTADDLKYAWNQMAIPVAKATANDVLNAIPGYGFASGVAKIPGQAYQYGTQTAQQLMQAYPNALPSALHYINPQAYPNTSANLNAPEQQHSQAWLDAANQAQANSASEASSAVQDPYATNFAGWTQEAPASSYNADDLANASDTTNAPAIPNAPVYSNGANGVASSNPQGVTEQGTLTIQGQQVPQSQFNPPVQHGNFTDEQLDQRVEDNGSVNGRVLPQEFYMAGLQRWGVKTNDAYNRIQQAYGEMGAIKKSLAASGGRDDEVTDAAKQRLNQLNAMIPSLQSDYAQASAKATQFNNVVNPPKQPQYNNTIANNANIDQQFNQATQGIRSNDAAGWNAMSRQQQVTKQQAMRDADIETSQRARDIEAGYAPEDVQARSLARQNALAQNQAAIPGFQQTLNLPQDSYQMQGGPASRNQLGIQPHIGLPRVANYAQMQGQLQARTAQAQDERMQNALAMGQAYMAMAGQRNEFNQAMRLDQLQNAERALDLKAANAQSIEEARYYRQQAEQAHIANESLRTQIMQSANATAGKAQSDKELQAATANRLKTFTAMAPAILKQFGLQGAIVDKNGNAINPNVDAQGLGAAFARNPPAENEDDDSYIKRVASKYIQTSLQAQVTDPSINTQTHAILWNILKRLPKEQPHPLVADPEQK